MVTLANLSRKVHVLTLVHEHVCTEDTCGCGRQLVGVADHDPATGGKKVRALKRKLAASVTLFSRGTEGDVVHGLPHGVLRLAEVKLAISRGELKATTGAAAAALHKQHLELEAKKRADAVAERVKAGDAAEAAAAKVDTAPAAVKE